ncbi:MAG TPA: protoporphyrinogen oxidase HemJ [Pseudomonadota bacterium]|jgi:putative membrane protein|nr:protoporphyrinogen oxidase HemJ [Pseudomonadota bacterium]HND10064.1 protoporphyrinogen oxidase HemJ [Pseudomonadota bacterium]HNF96230.1 protoporphyrinogen oxidase HemJ [Pseudomonadota bacterium]HNK45665.1 protoporphyrinogen oxidase HemJ [Pseudomonadota bacterium]HNN53369.1 protoporphyrinogen oxidase HemJ [Pseudomonadota bacterium]
MLWIKALHVIMVISWMAGLLYLYRLFVYHAMETEEVCRERFKIMERKLLRGIAHPAGAISVITGVTMLVMNPGYLKMPWMHAKLTFVLGLLISHGQAMYYRQKLIENPTAYSHKKFRLLNEVPTLLMIGIVIMVIVRPF